MEKKKRKPIPTSIIIGILFFVVGGMLFFKAGNTLSSLLCLVLAIMIGMINGVLLPCSTVLLRGEVSKKELNRYRNFALFYLKDRRISYTKSNFESAIEENWLDIVTMCLLLGMRKAYEPKDQERILLTALYNDNRKIYEVLLRGGFNGHFIVSGTGEHFIFEVLNVQDPIYLELLLKKRINPNLTNSEGDTALFVAIKEDKIKHIEVLLKYGSDLKLENKKGLTPLFYALKEGKLAICEILIEKMKKEKTNHEIVFKRLKEPLLVNAKPSSDNQYLLLKLIESKDEATLELLKKYFTDKGRFYATIDTEVELYTRLTSIEGSMVKKEEVTGTSKTMYTEEECKKDLFSYILKKYRFGKVDDFMVDGIYKEPKCIDSYKEECSTCSGTAHITCTQCDGEGTESCKNCKGTGETVCSKCGGTLKVSCEKIQKYLECKNCKDGMFECVKCDDEGNEPCPQCGGHGTKKCQCPPDKKMKCPHCDKGYISIKGGMYKKCSHCKDGEICLLCHNTGWVDKKYMQKGYECKVCKGTGKIPCQTCKGKKKVRCGKRFEVACDCKTGYETCQKCGGTTTVTCSRCHGTKEEKCTQCTDGFLYTNVYIDFKAHQSLQSESIVSKVADKSILKDLVYTMTDKICEKHPYINEVYTVFQIGLKPGDVTIRSNGMQAQVGKMISEKSTTGILDILELAPLHYTKMTFKEKDGYTYECILINDTFYKTTVK